MEFLEAIKQRIPDYAKDIRLNLDTVIARSTLSQAEAAGAALSAAFAAGSKELVTCFKESGLLSPEEIQAALTASALMGMTNSWYSYIDLASDESLKTQQAQLRMNAYSNHGGLDKRRFELYALAASIVGKCRFCISAHAETLKQEGLSTEQLRDIGRVAAVIQAVSLILKQL